MSIIIYIYIYFFFYLFIYIFYLYIYTYHILDYYDFACVIESVITYGIATIQKCRQNK